MDGTFSPLEMPRIVNSHHEAQPQAPKARTISAWGNAPGKHCRETGKRAVSPSNRSLAWISFMAPAKGMQCNLFSCAWVRAPRMGYCRETRLHSPQNPEGSGKQKPRAQARRLLANKTKPRRGDRKPLSRIPFAPAGGSHNAYLLSGAYALPQRGIMPICPPEPIRGVNGSAICGVSRQKLDQT
jgi:hypothetical protein